MGLLEEVTAVLFVKDPRPGAVKTRLSADGRYTAEQAAAIAQAMLRCSAERLAAAGRLVLAVTPDESGAALARGPLAGIAARWCAQGPGNLGERLTRVWRGLEGCGPIAFFGIDSPDVPGVFLAEIPRRLRDADAAAGPTPDGGYWMIGAARCQPALLAGIDWGTAAVYDQTVRRAEAAGLTLSRLPSWPDVDTPQDLDALRRRLACGAGAGRGTGKGAGAGTSDEALRNLARRLAELGDERGS